jgi:hypothetical protein
MKLACHRQAPNRQHIMMLRWSHVCVCVCVLCVCVRACVVCWCVRACVCVCVCVFINFVATSY